MMDIDREKIEHTRDDIQLMKLSNRNPDDELEKTLRHVKRLRVSLAILLALGLLLGWAVGSFLPIPGTRALREGIRQSQSMNSSDKINAAFDIMENDWFFGSQIEDLDTRLSDQALRGIFDNEEDPHTEYLSAEEVVAFRQSIDRDFVGIGVEFINTNGMNLVTKVFKDSPAQKAGVQAGDIIKEIDGVSAEGMTSADVKEHVQGEEGTDVVILFSRQGEDVSITITRAAITATAFGYLIDDETAYLQLYQFGTGTAGEIDGYLAEFRAAGAKKLVIDLRDNGGGYLDALAQIASRFLPGGTLVMIQEYADGTRENTYTSTGYTQDFGPIVILINGNTASASEVFALAMKEQRDDVTIAGTVSYGKGTVQITRMFNDSSAIKYTTSKWISPNEVWVNNTGIEPDVAVDVPEGIDHVYLGMEEGSEFAPDSVGEQVKEVQVALDYLGYEVDRKDGYFSEATLSALNQFASDKDIAMDGKLTPDLYEAVVSALVLDWNTTTQHDTQLSKALEILNG